MSHFDDFVNLMRHYLNQKCYPIKICSDISSTSYSSESGKSLVNSRIPVVDMDEFAKKAYRKIILPGSISEDDSINTADAFLINSCNEWFFIEFKDAKVSKTKANILKKAYSNVYAIMDVLYTVREENEEYSFFNYNNPVKFFKSQVNYILVFSASKNSEHVQQLKNHRLKNENYLPEFMKRLEGYIFKEVYAMTEDVFEYGFLKKFRF